MQGLNKGGDEESTHFTCACLWQGTVADLNALRAYPATVPIPKHPSAVCFPMCSYFAFSLHVSRGRYHQFTRANFRGEVISNSGRLLPSLADVLSACVGYPECSPISSQTPGGYDGVLPAFLSHSGRLFPRVLADFLSARGGDPEGWPMSLVARSIKLMTTISFYQPNLACQIGCKSCFGGSRRAEGVVREAPGGLPGAI